MKSNWIGNDLCFICIIFWSYFPRTDSFLINKIKSHRISNLYAVYYVNNTATWRIIFSWQFFVLHALLNLQITIIMSNKKNHFYIVIRAMIYKLLFIVIEDFSRRSLVLLLSIGCRANSLDYHWWGDKTKINNTFPTKSWNFIFWYFQIDSYQ